VKRRKNIKATGSIKKREISCERGEITIATPNWGKKAASADLLVKGKKGSAWGGRSGELESVVGDVYMGRFTGRLGGL